MTASAIFADGRTPSNKVARQTGVTVFVITARHGSGFPRRERMHGARRLDALDGRPLKWRGVWLWYHFLRADALVWSRWRLQSFAASRRPASRPCLSNSKHFPSVLLIPR